MWPYLRQKHNINHWKLLPAASRSRSRPFYLGNRQLVLQRREIRLDHHHWCWWPCKKFRKWIKSPNDAWLRAMTPITNLSDEQEIQTALPHNYCLDDPHQYSVVASIIFWHLVAMTNAPTGFLWREWTHCVFNKHKPKNEYPKTIPKITSVLIYPKIWQNTMWLFLKDEEMIDYRVSQSCVT